MEILSARSKTVNLSPRKGKMATRAASLSRFLLFFGTYHAERDVAQCYAICISFARGDSHMKGAGMLIGNLELNP